MTFTGSLSKPPLILEWEPSEVPLMSGVGQDTPSGTEFFSSLGSSMCGGPGCDDDLWWDLLWVFMPHLAILSRYRQNQAHSCPKPSYCRCIGMVRGMDIRNTCHRKSMSCSFHVSTSWTNTANCCLVAMCVAMATSPSGLPSSSMAFLVLTCHASRPPSLWLNCFGGCLCVWPSFW